MADTQRRAKRDSHSPEGVSATRDPAPHSMTVFTERIESRRTAFALTTIMRSVIARGCVLYGPVVCAFLARAEPCYLLILAESAYHDGVMRVRITPELRRTDPRLPLACAPASPDAAGQSCDADIVEKTVALVEELDMDASVLISSFNHEYLRRAKKAAPGIATAALTDNSIPDIIGRLREIGAIAWHPNGRKLDEATARSVRDAGFDLNVWTVNEESDMRRFVSWGATGLITDFTERARRVADLTQP